MQEDTKLCANCKKDIAASNYVMHEMHCRRHIILCEHCGEPIPRVEIDQHFNDVHAKVPCERCHREIPRSNVVSHMESECSKKPMSCEFCELSFPKDEYEAHCDYCGSRTECCPLCQQYIMLKDMALHEASGCTHPEPKPTPVQPPSSDSDPFSMAHLQEFLDVDSQLRASDDIPDFTANLRHELHQFNAGRAPRRSVPSRGRRSKNTVNERASNARSTRSNFHLGRNSNNDNNSDNNNRGGSDNDVSSFFPPGINPWEAIPPDMDYDTMLALQLAHADWAEDNCGPDRNEQQPSPTLPESPGPEDTIPFRLATDANTDTQPQDNRNLFAEDGYLTIPCEFCELEVPMSTYLDHAEACPLSNPAVPSDEDYGDRNNELPVTQSYSQRNSIPVINNLRSERPDRQFQTTSQLPSTFDNDAFVEDVILPCEFCEEMFPSEIIVQHQSVCQASGVATPRAITPASGLRAKRSSQPEPNSTSGGSFSTFGKSTQAAKQRHQPDPKSLDPHLSDDDDEPQSNFFRDQSYKDLLQSTSDKYSPAVDRFDDSVTRPPRRSSRQLSNEDSQDNRMVASDPERPSKSAQRTRASLNQLLQENQEALPAGPASTRARGIRIPQRGRQTGDNQNTTEARAARSMQVDTRTVMRELDRVQPAAAAAASGRTTRQPLSTNPSNLPPTAESSSRSTRGNSSTNRQSRNQMFSPELRLKPDHNPSTRRRR